MRSEYCRLGLKCCLFHELDEYHQATNVQSHEHYMQHALALASRGVGCVSPNPLVGCVAVLDGDIIGEGWHALYGEAHAEVNAINDALARVSSLAGATLICNT